jgi:hypothetical protein
VDLNNASLLGFQRTNEFLNSNFRFGSRVSYEIEGYFVDLQNDIGVSGLISASEFFRTGLQDYQPIILNGSDFGKGRVTNFSTNNENSLQYSTYNLSIDGFQSGNLSNLSGKYYSGLSPLLTGNTALEAPYLLEEFSEDFNIDRNGESFSYTHNINIKYASGDGVIITPIQRAKGLATEIFKTVEPPFELLDSFPGNSFFTGAVNEKFSESYDLINNSVSFSRVFVTNPLGYEKYSVKHSQNFTKNSNGQISVSEEGSIKVNSFSLENDLSEAIKIELSGSYDRCSEIYLAYGNSLILPSGATSTSQNIDNFLGEANYSINYSDFDSNDDENYIFNIVHSIDRVGDIINISEEGSIIGRGDSDLEKMQKSVNGYNIEKLNVYNRSNSFYQERGGNKDLELESTSFNKNTENSSVKYNYSFSDDSSLVDGRRIDIVVQDQDSINRFNTFSSLGVKQFVQKVDSTTQGSRDLRISIEGQESDTLDILLGVAKLIANNHVKIYNDTYIDDATYNFDVEEKNLQVSVKYNFNKLVRSKEIL